MPLVSIIIATYNEADLLRESLASVRRQTFSDWECLIEDDGSPDQTAAVAEEYISADRRICYYRHPHVGAPALARNAGIQHSSGEYIIFLDSDDLCEPNRLERVVATFREHPDVGVVYHDLLVFDHDNPSRQERYFAGRHHTPSGVIFETQYQSAIQICPSTATKRSVFDRYGTMLGPDALQIADDYEFFLRVSPFVRCHYIDEPLTRFRRGKGSHLTGNLIRGLENRIRALEIFDNNNPDLAAALGQIRDDTYGDLYYKLCRAYLWSSGKSRQARAALLKSIRFSPSAAKYTWLIMLALPGSAAALVRIRAAVRAAVPVRRILK